MDSFNQGDDNLDTDNDDSRRDDIVEYASRRNRRAMRWVAILDPSYVPSDDDSLSSTPISSPQHQLEDVQEPTTQEDDQRRSLAEFFSSFDRPLPISTPPLLSLSMGPSPTPVRSRVHSPSPPFLPAETPIHSRDSSPSPDIKQVRYSVESRVPTPSPQIVQAQTALESRDSSSFSQVEQVQVPLEFSESPSPQNVKAPDPIESRDHFRSSQLEPDGVQETRAITDNYPRLLIELKNTEIVIRLVTTGERKRKSDKELFADYKISGWKLKEEPNTQPGWCWECFYWQAFGPKLYARSYPLYPPFPIAEEDAEEDNEEAEQEDDCDQNDCQDDSQ
ncbi:unnamed protein product [Caenorhabditis bovis]|uniref:Uncharacterized protein n=1 Tax=Caenorhabditis bovis TaxID=2654633 RepID=A0A8S1FD89_9PELO|nr:unnamed protein product [Caenorhabditis bovis]